MVTFLSISTFRHRLQALLNIKRGVYSGVPAEICKAFQGVAMEQIRQNRDMLLFDDDSITIKLRLPDKKQHLSKADGYRLIYVALKKVDVVTFLDIYPKRGPLQQLNEEDNELIRLINEFVQEMTDGNIQVHDINNSLAVLAL